MPWLLSTIMGLLVVAIVAHIYFSAKHNTAAHTDDGAPMPTDPPITSARP